MTTNIVNLWFAVPLVVAVSLVYAATRHEEGGALLRHALRVALWIVGFMAVIFAILWLVSGRIS